MNAGLAILNGTVYTPEEKIVGGVVLVSDGKIRGVGLASEMDIPAEAERIDARGAAIAPGLIDLHTYGCLGVQITSPERAADELQSLAYNVARFGVTRFLISPPMGDIEELTRMLTAIAVAIPQLSGGARCAGIHLEGPYLDPEQRGAFPRRVLREPRVDEVSRLVDAAGGFIRVVTMAPNLPGSREVARFLHEHGMIVSLGHTSATFEKACQALAPNGGFSLVTHVFNAMSGLHHRRPGAAGAALLSAVPAMLICDGEHVHPGVVKILLRQKTAEGVILVTDAIAGAGLEEGEYTLFDQQVLVRAGRATLSDGTLAGSVLTLNRAVMNARGFAGIDLSEALEMATSNPARVLKHGVSGTLHEGAEADVVVMDERTGQVRRTMIGGVEVFKV